MIAKKVGCISYHEKSFRFERKIGTRGVHVSTARETEMCYSLGTSVGDVTRLNVANVVRLSLYI